MTFEHHAAMTIWNVPYPCLSFAVGTLDNVGKIVTQFQGESTNAWFFQYDICILERMFQTQQILETCLTSESLPQQGTLLDFVVPFWCVAPGFSTNSRICLRCFQKVKIFSQMVFDCDLPWYKVKITLNKSKNWIRHKSGQKLFKAPKSAL